MSLDLTVDVAVRCGRRSAVALNTRLESGHLVAANCCTVHTSPQRRGAIITARDVGHRQRRLTGMPSLELV